jgi:hypothetical protein
VSEKGNFPGLTHSVSKFLFKVPQAAWYGPDDSITWMKRWEEIIDIAKKSYGNGARIAMYPDATVQYFG